jgi:hypothetical protein
VFHQLADLDNTKMELIATLKNSVKGKWPTGNSIPYCRVGRTIFSIFFLLFSHENNPLLQDISNQMRSCRLPQCSVVVIKSGIPLKELELFQGYNAGNILLQLFSRPFSCHILITIYVPVYIFIYVYL